MHIMGRKKPDYTKKKHSFFLTFAKNRKKLLFFHIPDDIMSPVESFGSVVASRCQSQAKRST
jgi:hypothetical protein